MNIYAGSSWSIVLVYIRTHTLGGSRHVTRIAPFLFIFPFLSFLFRKWVTRIHADEAANNARRRSRSAERRARKNNSSVIYYATFCYISRPYYSRYH